MPALLEFFHTDFPEPAFEKKILFTRDRSKPANGLGFGEIIEVRERLVLDSGSWVRTFTFYLPAKSDSFLVCKSLFIELEKLREEADQLPDGFPELLTGSRRSIVYSRRIYVYSEEPLGVEQLEELRNQCRDLGFALAFRSQDYVLHKLESGKPLAYIAHDLLDRTAIAATLAAGLRSRGCFAWYEDYALVPSMHPVERLCRGLEEARRGILVVSPAMLTTLSSVRKEFNRVFTREKILNERMLVPIWVRVTKDEVSDLSSSLAESFSLAWPLSSGKTDEEFQREVELLVSRLHIQLGSLEGIHRFH
jgi:hypothetical protein